MLNSLSFIAKVKAGNKRVLRDNRWLLYLYITEEQHVNLERVESLKDIQENHVLLYVERTLQLLNEMDIPAWEKELIEEVLIWSEVAKGGMKHKRLEWEEKGFQLAIHNIGSAQIYAAEQMNLPFHDRNTEREELIYILILTHGLIGQFIRGEVRYQQFQPLIQWIKEHKDLNFNISRILYTLNRCIIEAVSLEIWNNVRAEVKKMIGWIVNGEEMKDYSLKERIKRLRQLSIGRGEPYHNQFDHYYKSDNLKKCLETFFGKTDMWYVESALQDFSLEEFLKIYLLIYQHINPLSLEQISFEPFMKDIYYDYKGKKATNLYKKRIIETYLRECTMEELLEGKIPNNEHVRLYILPLDPLGQIIGVHFSYSKAGQKLIEFCQEAEKSPLYERSIILLYDFFGFRKDAFDRLQNEQTYLTDMNSGHDHKQLISDYAIGNILVDIGAGGGVMLDILSENHPHATVVGIDLSLNVIEELNRRKFRENKSWIVKQADALKLKEHFEPNSVDTIVFSSILHELYSYVPYNGEKFNSDVVIQALKSSFEILSPGGRMIIRDGIMTEPKEEMRLLEFFDPSGLAFFKRYVMDFKGRMIQYEQLDDMTIKLPVNDLMEFCYTYTWGEEAYPHEVQEQFGYFTPNEYREVIAEMIGESGKIIEFRHYLQDGYEEFLLPKVKVMDENGEKVSLPDSTCFIVVEKME
ncbi:class I SAM-dependent methyltransferase [Bacillus niameyensis]|uniref:class I SAM-dependent methyltransferase n=1 Tax=Bacillus niameyensis TaxID=1522308 RepID=UPI0007818AD9|nr:class I SAM-dependent methyltransferase [Bacillus niameyensis]